MTEHKVLVVSQLPPPVHGSTVMTGQFISALISKGFDVALVDRRFSRSPDEVGRFALHKVFAGLHLWWRLARSVMRERPSGAVLFFTNRPASFIVDYVSIRILKIWRVPYVLYIHTNGYSSLAAKSGMWEKLVKSSFSGAARTVTLGSALKADLSGLVADKLVSLIPNSPPVQVPYPSELPVRDGIVVGFLSNLLPAKGVGVFLQVAKAIASEHANSPICFEILGNGSPDAVAEVRAATQDSGTYGHLAYHGHQTGFEKWQIMAGWDLLLFPSTYKYEAQPLSILECQSLGIPCVAFDIGGLRDIIGNANTGWLLPSGDVVGMTQIVHQYSTRGRQDRAAIRRVVAESYMENFSIEKYADAWAEVLLSSFGDRGAVDEI